MRITVLFILILSLTFSALAQSGGVKGKVISESTDKSLPGVEITVEQNSQKLKSTTSDQKGNFYFDGLADGLYMLTFEKDGYSRSTIRIEVKKSKITDLSGRRLALPVDRSTFVTIQGTVFDQEGFSLGGAKVEIAKKTSGNVWEKLKTQYTSEDGEFLARFQPEIKDQATYRITVTFKDATPISKEKMVDFAGIYRLAFNMPVKRGQ